MKQFYKACILFLALVLIPGLTYAQVSQNFEGITAQNLTGTCLYVDPDQSTVHVVQNITDPDCPGLITVLSPSAGSVLGFQNILDPVNTSQPSSVGFSDGDAFGVATSASLMTQLGAGAPEGSQGFVMEDIDGDITMEFDNVDLSGTTSPMVSLQYFLSSTTYEAPDFLTVTVEITGCGAATTVTLLDADTPAELDAIEGSWNTLSANLTAYVGCTAVLRIEYSSDSSAEELGIDIINFTEGVIGMAADPPVCPTIGSAMTSDADVCLDETFTLTASGLMTMDMASNNEADFGIEFRAHPTTTTTPYVGGISLGTVPFGSLTSGGTVATLAGASISYIGNFSVYAILSPSPLDAACRPSAVTTVMVSGCDVACDPMNGVSATFEAIYPQPLNGGSCAYVDADNVSIHQLQNITAGCGPITVLSMGYGTTLGFENILDPINTSQAPADGFTDGDAFGVTDNPTLMTELGANAPEGTQAFLMEDIDADVAMNFEMVDLTGTTSPMFSMQYILSETSWEAADFLNIHIEITGCGAATSISLINVSGAAMDGVEGSWNTLMADLTPYVGCMAQLVVEYSANAAAEELGIDDISFSQGCRAGSAAPIVCPTIGTPSASEPAVCLGDPFDVSVDGLTNMDMAGNTDQDYGISFVAFPAPTTTPYVGGIVLGTVPFGSLTAGNTTAAITGASLGMSGTFQVYAILSPTPLDASCRPSGVTSIDVMGCPEPCDVMQSVGTSFETIVPQNLGAGGCLYTDPDMTMHQLQNMTPTCGPITVLYEGFGNTLGFENIFSPSANGSTGFSDGDAFGVTTSSTLMTEVGAGATDGSQGFLMEDIDGDVAMNFDEVSLVGTTASIFSMDYILSETSWETEDFLNIHIEITGCGAATSVSLINLSGAALDGVEGSWNTLMADLTPYVGCTAQLVVEFSSSAAAEELAIDNIVFSQGCIIFPIVCPTVAAVSASETTVCENESFDITATGLATMDAMSNMEQDFGIEFVFFGSSTADPYTGGTSLGTVPFGSLTAGGTTASLVGATIPTADPTGFIYAILSPAPFNPTCRPFAETTIEVQGSPSVDVTVPQAFCEGAGVVTVGPIVFPSATTVVHSGTGVTDNGNNTDFQFDVTAVGVGVHPVTVTLTNAAGCETVVMVNMTVNALPTVGFTAPADLCINDGVQAGLGGGTPPQGTVTGDMGVYSGDGVTDDGNGMTYSFDPAIAGVGTHTLTYTYTDENGCTNSASDDVEIFALPNVTFTALADLCLTDVPVTGLGGGSPTGGVYSGTGVIDDGNGMTYTFEPGTAGVGTHTITYTVGVAGCTGMAMDDVEVFALPTVTLDIPMGEDAVCIDVPTYAVNLAGSPTGGVYSGTGVTDLGTGISFTFDPAAAGAGMHTVTYTFTDANGCTGMATDIITVFPLPIVTFTAPADICVDAGVQAGLGGGSPMGGISGVYSGPGVTDDGNQMTYSFDPAAAGVGVHTITYTFTDESGCTNSASDMVEVFAIPNVTFTALADLCVDAGAQAGLGGGVPTGGVYSGTGVTDDGNGMTYSFDPAVAGVGVHTITYDYTDANGCSFSVSDDVEVFDLPAVSLATALGYCLDAPIAGAPITGGSPAGGVYSGPGVTDLGNGMSYNFDPMVAGVGIHVITYTITDANGCTNSATSNLEVFDCAFEITDPCNCLDNATTIDIDAGTGGDDGQFSEIVSVSNATGAPLPMGQTWVVVAATGAFDSYNIPPIGVQSAGVALATDGSLSLTFNNGVYELPFVHVDALGYSITIEGPFPMGSAANVMITITNNCSYPNPTFDPALLSVGYCVQDPAVPLGATEPSGVGADAITFTINGNPEVEFDPVALGAGNHVVVMTYDGADDGNGGVAPMGDTAYPGCIQTVTQTIFVDPVCCEPPADVISLAYQMCEMTDAVDSDGDGMVEDGIPTLEVTNPEVGATYSWFGPMDMPPADPSMGSIAMGTTFTPATRPGVGNTDTYWVVGSMTAGVNTCYNNPVAITLTENPTPEPPIVINEPVICLGELMSPATSPYCNTSVFHFADMNPVSEAILTVENTGPNSMQIILSSPNPADPIDDVVIPGGSGAMIVGGITGPNEYTVDLTWGGPPPPVVNLNILWSFVSFPGFWQLNANNFDIPFDVSCTGETALLEVTCTQPNSVVFTLDPSVLTLGFMNVFELPINGGAYVFGSPWAPADLVALFSGDEVCLQPNQIGDPDPFWYIGGGGPGAQGNKIMEANLYGEDQTGAYAGQTMTFTLEVTQNDASCGHESSLYIREFNPGFAGILMDVFVPIAGPGVYAVTMPISGAGGPVQWGLQTVGPNVWVTDAPACGSVKAVPVNVDAVPAMVNWYDMPTGGTLQGTGETLDPTGTTAEEGPFDPFTPGTYTYYAECVASYEGCESNFVDRTFTDPAEFSGNETYINFDDLPAMENILVGNEYAAQGLTISTTGAGPFAVTNNGFSPVPYPSLPNGLINFTAATGGGPYVPITFTFDEIQNRAGFNFFSNVGTTTVTITCSLNGTVVGSETYPTNLTFTYLGIESAIGFDQLDVSVAAANSAFRLDDLSFEGCNAESIPDPLMCESTRVPVTITVIGAVDPDPRDYQMCSQTDFVDSDDDGMAEDGIPTFEIETPIAGETYSWYGPSDVAPVDPTMDVIATGETFTPTDRPGVGNTDTYWVISSVMMNGVICYSNPVPFTLTEQPTPFPPTAIDEPVVCVDETDIPPLVAECASVGDVVFTLDGAGTWLGFMNVFELPENGGGYVFGSGWGTADLVALYNGDEICLQPNQIGDPDPFWYIGGGGPGAPGNKIMEANFYQEDQTSAYVNQTITFAVEVTSNDFSCGHTSSLYIREFNPGFAGILMDVFVPITGPGLYTVSMPISANGGPVQWGLQTVGPNVWVTDAPACGSIKAIPAIVTESMVQWYDAPTGGDLQGMGDALDPTGTMAEEGAFDINTPGIYTYYAECKSTYIGTGPCAIDFVDRTFTDPAEFSGMETYINFDDLPAMENILVGNEYAAQGLTISTTGAGPFAVTNNGFSPVPYPSLPNGLINFTAATAGGPYVPITFTFDEIQNRAGFNFFSNTGTTTVTITCSLNGTVVGSETYPTGLSFTYLGIESEMGFDQLDITVAAGNSAFRLDDLSFEGCPPEMLMCESDRTPLEFTVVGFENLTATQVCDYTTTDAPHDYDIELCFDVLQGGPSGMFDVYVDDGNSPNMTNIDEYNGAASESFAYADLGPSIDGMATNCVLLSAADLDATDMSTVTVSIIDWDVANMMNGATADVACASVDFDEFLCCNPDAGTQSLGPVEVCTDVTTSLAPAGTTTIVDVTFDNLAQEPEAGLNNYAWIITDANLDIVNVVGSTNYNIATPADFSDEILLNDASGTMLGIGTYCIHGINYRDATIPENAGNQGITDLTTLQGLVGMNAADIIDELLENDGVLTMAGADGTFTICADLNVETCTPVIINPTPEIVAQPEDMYQCAGDDATFSATAFVLPGDHLDPNPSTLIFTLEWSQDDGANWTEFVGATADPAQPIIGPTGTETVTFTVPGVTLDMNCSLWRIVVTADHNPDPDCFMISETAKLYVHGGGQMSCNDRVNYSADQNCEFNPHVADFYEGDYDTCNDDEIAYLEAFFSLEFETQSGLPVDVEDLRDYINYDNCLIYRVIDNCTGNSCWGEICLEDKLAPTIECACPPGAWQTDPACQITCDDVERYLDGRRGTPTVEDNCEDAEPFFGGAQIVETECGEYILTQNWSVTTEGYPGQAYPEINCVNEYYVTTPRLADELECPDDVTYDCTEPAAGDLFHPDVTGYPEFGRIDLDGSISFCNISAGFDDLEIPACGDDCYGPIKVLRTWTILDWCTLESETCTQVIKIVDNTPPTIIADDVTVSTQPWVCSADVWFDDPQLHDDCDYNLDWHIAWTNSGATLVDEDGMSGPNAGPLKHALGVPKGTWIFALTSVDCCGNPGTTQITVTVIDKAPPVAIGTENLVVSLTSSGDDWDGTAKVFAESVDNGSHDNCSDVWIEIRRDSDNCDIDGNMTYSNKIPEICDPWYDNDDHDYGEFVKFCCNDLTETDSLTGVNYGMVKVWMRVWDDGNMDGEHGSYTYYDNPGNDHDYCEFEDNYNEIWVWVRVEEKAPVSLLCPPDVTIPCHWDYTDLSLTGEAIASGTCDHPEVEYVDWPEIHCGEGFVLREWSVPGYDYVCVQRITIEYVDSELEVVCPTYEDFDGEIWFDPFNPNHVSVDCMEFEFPEPWQSGGKCSLVGVNEQIDTFWFEADACFKAIKTWHYVDWCTGEEANCSFVVSLVDTQPPVVMCQDTCFAVDDYWDDDNDGIVCEMASDVNVQSMAMDSGECGSEWIKWVAEVDLWYDGTVDLTYSSFFAHNDPFYVAPTLTGDPVTIRLDKDDISAEWARHVIEWKAFDGCGNVDQCHQYVEVADKKAPTPYCVGVSTALMSPEAGELVEIWAKDFNLGSYDNCTAEHWLRYSFNEVPPIVELIDEDHCFQPVWFNKDLCVPLRDSITGYIISEEVNNCNGYEDGAQNPDCIIDGVQKWMPNGVDEDGNPCKTSGMKFKGIEWCGENDIRICVWDKKLNMDFCSVNLIIHGNACPDGGIPTSRISGTIATETGSTVEGVEVINSGNQISGGSMSMMTAADGQYAFESIIDGGDYAIEALRDVDYLNGVSTLDLVLIQKHILGLAGLDSGYKVVAADINNDTNVTAVDLVELRKLILGIYTELPDNNSWRFVDADQPLNIQNPWPLSEKVNISNLQTDMTEDFVAIKIGDVNGNVVANATDIDFEERSATKLDFIVKRLDNGSLAVAAGSNFQDVYGYQFTMKVTGQVTAVVGMSLDLTEANFGVLGNGIVTTSFASEKAVNLTEGEVLFVLNGVQSMQLVNGITKAEAYQGGSLNIISVELRNADTEAIYSLAQNEPNPFSEETSITFSLAKAGTATLTIYDVTGKVIKTIEGEYAIGKHTINLKKDELQTAGGILHYKLESGNFVGSKRMIFIR